MSRLRLLVNGIISYIKMYTRILIPLRIWRLDAQGGNLIALESIHSSSIGFLRHAEQSFVVPQF